MKTIPELPAGLLDMIRHGEDYQLEYKEECIIYESIRNHKWRYQYAESKEGRDSDYDKDGSGDV